MKWYLMGNSTAVCTVGHYGPEPVLNIMPEQFDALEMGPEKHQCMNRTPILLKLVNRTPDPYSTPS